MSSGLREVNMDIDGSGDCQRAGTGGSHKTREYSLFNKYRNWFQKSKFLAGIVTIT